MSNAKQTQAWLMPINSKLKFLVPLTCSQELLENPSIINLPSAREDCHGLLSWRDKLLPYLDLGTTFGKQTGEMIGSYAQVLAVEDQQQNIQFVAINLQAPPVVVSIDASMSYPLPSEFAQYADLLPAAVMLEQQLLAVLNLQQLLAS